jgi:hypothetical protein
MRCILVGWKLSVIKGWSFKWSCNNCLAIIISQTICNPCGNGYALSSQCSTNSIYREHKRRKSSSTGGTVVLGWLLWEGILHLLGWRHPSVFCRSARICIRQFLLLHVLVCVRIWFKGGGGGGGRLLLLGCVWCMTSIWSHCCPTFKGLVWIFSLRCHTYDNFCWMVECMACLFCHM